LLFFYKKRQILLFGPWYSFCIYSAKLDSNIKYYETLLSIITILLVFFRPKRIFMKAQILNMRRKDVNKDWLKWAAKKSLPREWIPPSRLDKHTQARKESANKLRRQKSSTSQQKHNRRQLVRRHQSISPLNRETISAPQHSAESARAQMKADPRAQQTQHALWLSPRRQSGPIKRGGGGASIFQPACCAHHNKKQQHTTPPPTSPGNGWRWRRRRRRRFNHHNFS